MEPMKEYFYDLLHFSKGVRWFVLTESMLGISIGIFNLLLNLHLLALGLNEAEIGAIASFGIIVSGAVSIPSSMLAYRLGRKNLLVLGLMLMAAGYAVFGTGTSTAAMYGAQFLQSAGLALLITTEVQLLYSYSKSKKEETQGFSMLFAVFTLFTGVGTLVGGVLPGWLGGASTDYQGAIITAGVFMLAGVAARWMMLPKETPAAASPGGSVPRYRLRMPGRAVWLYCGLNLLVGTSAALIDPFLNVIVKLRLDWTDTQTSLLLTAHGVVLFAASFIMPPMLERLGRRTTYRLVFLSNLVISLVLAAAMPVGLFSFFLLARGGAFIMLNNLILTHSMSSLGEEDRDAFAGLRMVLRSLGSSVAAYGTGVLLAGKQYGLPFLLAGVGLAAAYAYYAKWVQPLFEERLDLPEEGVKSPVPPADRPEVTA